MLKVGFIGAEGGHCPCINRLDDVGIESVANACCNLERVVF